MSLFDKLIKKIKINVTIGGGIFVSMQKIISIKTKNANKHIFSHV